MARATTKKTVAERVISNKKDIKTSFAMGRRIKSGVSSNASIGSGQGSGGAVDVTGHFLETAGGTMIGPIAFFPADISVISDSITLVNENSSSYVIVLGQGAAADNLSKIVGARFSGQELIIQAAAGTPITLKDIATPGNIHLPGGTDVLIPALDAVTLIFDPTQSGGGRWILSAGSGSGGSSGANKTLSNLDPTSINQSLIPNTNVAFDLGSALKSWDSLWLRRVKFDDDATTPTDLSPNQISHSSGSMDFNVDVISDSYIWYYDGVPKWSMSQNTLSGNNIILNNTFTINDSGVDPAANGQFSRVGVDVKVFSGGAIRNLSTSGGADTALSNLIPTSINQSLVPNADVSFDLGTELKSWDSLWLRRIKFGDEATSPTDLSPNQISFATNSMDFNVDAPGSTYIWWFNGVQKWSMSDFAFSGSNIILSNTLTINDSGVNPAGNGQFSRVGNDVKVQSGGIIRNLSDMVSLSTNNIWTGTNTFNNIVAFNSQANFNSSIVLGDSSGDLITFVGRVNTDILPSSSGVRDLGSASLQFDEVRALRHFCSSRLLLPVGTNMYG